MSANKKSYSNGKHHHRQSKWNGDSPAQSHSKPKRAWSRNHEGEPFVNSGLGRWLKDYES